MINVPEIVKTDVAKAMGLKSASFRIDLRNPLEFQSNRLYDIWTGDRHLIAKEYLHPDELEAAPLREFKALQLVSPLDVAPQPIYFDPATGPIVVYEYMEGEMWDRRAVTPADLAKLLDVWIRTNSVTAEWFSRGSENPLVMVEEKFHGLFVNYLEWTKLEFKPGERAAEMCLELFESRHGAIQELSQYTPALCFTRSDPRFANVIQRPDGRLGLVDWEDSGLRDPAREVADLITHPNQEDLLSWKEWQAFVPPYLDSLSRVDETIASRTHLYLAIFPFFWLTGIIQRGIRLASAGQLAGWTINGLSGNQRLRRYLARELSWPDMDFEKNLVNLGTIAFFPGEFTR